VRPIRKIRVSFSVFIAYRGCDHDPPVQALLYNKSAYHFRTSETAGLEAKTAVARLLLTHGIDKSVC